jgi:hypothetical protein
MPRRRVGDRARTYPISPRTHPGPTVGYRISEGDTSLCYIPDQELALGPSLSVRERQSLPGFALAYGASLLVHDCQYTDDNYASHIGWGHSCLGDVLAFARLTEEQRVLLFHHDSFHDDEQLDRFHARALARWDAAGGSLHEVLMAAELQELELQRGQAYRGPSPSASAHPVVVGCGRLPDPESDREALLPPHLGGLLPEAFARTEQRQGAPELLDRELVPALQMPVFFFLGRNDHFVPAEISIAYIDALSAPSKRVV